MALLISITIGAAIGWLASRTLEGLGGTSSSAVVGVFGALLGCAAIVWLSSDRTSPGLDANTLLSAALGAVALLLLWSTARRIAFSPRRESRRPGESNHSQLSDLNL